MQFSSGFSLLVEFIQIYFFVILHKWKENVLHLVIIDQFYTLCIKTAEVTQTRPFSLASPLIHVHSLPNSNRITITLLLLCRNGTPHGRAAFLIAV